MLKINDLSSVELLKIRIACAYLFSPELAEKDEFLKNLNHLSIKNAFDEKTKQYSPEIQDSESSDFSKEEEEGLFIMTKASYEALKNFLGEEDKSGKDQRAPQPKIIAVGGAKGGTGKTMFAANLGIFLSSKGIRTTMIDLDLGSANLHLYLGITTPKFTINDFLTKRAPQINEIKIPTKYGPDLIGGDSSQLGAANIDFSRKLKLLRSIKKIDADYVIMDLGGDTSYNIIDFFLAADHGFVMMTCYPASFLDAYNFIKIALYRKLNRIFGPESALSTQKDRNLMRLIHEATIGTNGNRVANMDQLLHRVKEQQPWNLSLINQVLNTFYPKLIVNMMEENSKAMKMVKLIQNVSQKVLSVKVGHIGNIPHQSEIERSARDLVPVVVKNPKGIFSGKIEHMIDQIVNQ